MISSAATETAVQDNLRNLLLVRGVFLTLVCASLLYCFLILDLALNYPLLAWWISALTLIEIASLKQLRQPSLCTETTFFVQLLIDILGVTGLLYLVGGADNPFVFYYLVPLCIAAATLSSRLIWPLLVAALGCYTLLMFYNIPLPDISPGHHHPQGAGVNIHTLGMWINFLVSAMLISYFVVKMANAVRRQQQLLADLREDRLRDEQLMAVATIAAGTAHEMGTPMTTIKTLVREMQHELSADHPELQGLRDDLELLENQVSHCSHTLKQLNARASEIRAGVPTVAHPAIHCRKVIDDWLLLRPEVEAHINIDDRGPELDISLHPAVLQAMANLFNNAADANPRDIEINITWNAARLRVQTLDRGPGIDADILANLGQAFNSSKGEGRGLGMFLAHATVKRHGGELQVRNRAGGGAETTMIVPIQPEEPGD